MIFLHLQPSFHNTSNLSGHALARANNKAKAQEMLIESLFARNPDVMWPPSLVQKELGIDLLTSVRRSITNLTKRGKLSKTTVQKKNMETGGMEYYWQYVPVDEQPGPQKLL